MLVWNIIYLFTQSSIEPFPVLFRSCHMYKFRVVPANFLFFRANNPIDQLLTKNNVM